jgi:hypothetical protein
MNTRTFTAAVYRHLLNDPDMPGTVREWVLTEPDPEQRALYLAARLAEDMISTYCDEDDADPESALHNRLMRMALDRVDWQRVAEALLRHFSLPVILASPAPPCCSPARFTWAPAAWRGPVN